MAFTDNFTDDNGTLLHDHDPSGGTAWSLDRDGGSDWRVNTNAIMCTNNGGGSGLTVYSCDDQGSANHYSQWQDILFNSGGDSYLCCRLVDYQNFLGWRLAGTGSSGSRFCTMIAGSRSDEILVQGADNDIIKLTCEGNTIKFYIDSGGGFAQQGGDQTIANFNTETTQGVATDDNTSIPEFEDFEAGPMAAGGVTLEIDTSECEK